MKVEGKSPRARFPKLHIETFEQFEGSRTFTNFIEPLLPKKRTEPPCTRVYLDARQACIGRLRCYEHSCLFSYKLA